MKSVFIAAGMVALALAGSASAQKTDIRCGPLGPYPYCGGIWFGVKPPPGLMDPPQIKAAKGKVLAPPVPRHADDAAEPEFAGARLDQDMRTVAAFAIPRDKRVHQFYGRIAGYPEQTRTAEWLADGFRRAGLSNVEVQTFDGTAEFWQPDSWEVRIKAGPAFNASRDVILRSAVPVSRSKIEGMLSAPLVYAGEAGAPVSVDVKGKIAIQHSRPTTGAYSDRAKIRDSGQALMKAGAVAVFNWVEQAGNMHVFDFGNCGGPCFNLGGADGQFLKDVLARANRPVMAELILNTKIRTDLKAQNVIATIPGKSAEAVIVNAHLDSWFAGAGDNADGIAVLAALARHYAKPANKPARTLIFVGSAGHHSSGLGGPPALLRMNKDRLAPTVLVLNLEHVAQMQISTDPWRVDPIEQPKSVGVSNSAPAVMAAFRAAAERYGFTTSTYSDSVPGDLGGYTPLGVARVQAIHSGPLYHTSGDVPDSISVRGLERAARTFAHFIDAVCAMPKDQINPVVKK